MSPLRQALADYLSIRRALGYRLERAEKLLVQYLDHLERLEEERVTVANAVAWATLPAAGSGHWWSFRMSVVRGFAAYLYALDPAHEVPPADLLPNRAHRAIPYLYSQEEIIALMAATGSLRFALRQATDRTLIGLLSVTGMRVGEAIRLDRGDAALGHGALTVHQTKFGKTRELSLHASTVAALRAYLRLRDRLCSAPASDALLVSPAGTRLLYTNVCTTLLDLVDRAGLHRPAAGRRPRLHDLRHTFAVRTLLDWYRAGADVQPRLPLLSTYLGHVHPKDTYWYLQAAPELLQIAAERLERAQAGTP
jgi:integrase